MRRTPGSPLEIPAAEWNRIQDPSSRTGRNESRRPIEPTYLREVGKNLSGATITAGSPVFYSNFTTDGTVTAYTPNPSGFYELRNCYWPQNSTDRALFVTEGAAFNRVGIALEDIANDDAGGFAIAGIVGVKCTGSAGRYARPTVKPNSYESQMTADVWGYRILGTYASWTLIDLDELYRGTLEGVTKSTGLTANVEDMVTVNGADFPAITKVSAIAGAQPIWLFPTDTQWLAARVC